MSSILVNTSVLHLKSSERKSALQHLLLVGLSKYTECTGSQTIDMAALQRLHGTYLRSRLYFCVRLVFIFVGPIFFSSLPSSYSECARLKKSLFLSSLMPAIVQEGCIYWIPPERSHF